MDWSRIKTIFILTFLVLDVYLMMQFLKILDENKYEIITETTVDDKLRSDQIDYSELPKQPMKDKYLSAKLKVFQKEDLAQLKGQTVKTKDGTMIQATFDKPIKLTNNEQSSELTPFIRTNILFGDQYRYWGKNEKEKTITYFQQYHEKLLYKNINGMLVLHYNNDNEITSYEQTLLVDIQGLSGKQEVLPPLKAIETLYDKGLLDPKSKITEVDIGYYTLVQLTSSQVLTPTWHIVVNGKKHLFVNAFEGQIIQIDKEESVE